VIVVVFGLIRRREWPIDLADTASLSDRFSPTSVSMSAGPDVVEPDMLHIPWLLPLETAPVAGPFERMTCPQ
jgi:hypothetical protein